MCVSSISHNSVFCRDLNASLPLCPFSLNHPISHLLPNYMALDITKIRSKGVVSTESDKPKVGQLPLSQLQ